MPNMHEDLVVVGAREKRRISFTGPKRGREKYNGVIYSFSGAFTEHLFQTEKFHTKNVATVMSVYVYEIF